MNDALTQRLNQAAKTRVRTLSICQALFTCAVAIDLTMTAVTGYQLAPTPYLSTLPFALITVASALTTLIASFVIERLGRLTGFSLGAGFGCLGGLISAWAVMHSDFWLFCVGTSFVGVFQAFAQYYRLAAADSVAAEVKARAISTVLAGGVIAAVVGPLLASWSKDALPASNFAGAYLMIAFLSLISVLALAFFYRDAKPPAAQANSPETPPARPLREALTRPIYLAALSNSLVSAVVMMLIMTAVPLATLSHGHGIDDGASIIQWHLVGMYAPSLVAGQLIALIGLPRMLMVGVALNLACVVTAVSSDSMLSYHLALFFLGVGWNFMFIGGTTLLTQSYTPAERAKVQALSEFLRFTFTALSTLAAGPIFFLIGWKSLNLAVLPLLLLSSLITLWWAYTNRPQSVPVQKPQAS